MAMHALHAKVVEVVGGEGVHSHSPLTTPMHQPTFPCMGGHKVCMWTAECEWEHVQGRACKPEGGQVLASRQSVLASTDAVLHPTTAPVGRPAVLCSTLCVPLCPVRPCGTKLLVASTAGVPVSSESVPAPMHVPLHPAAGQGLRWGLDQWEGRVMPRLPM
jgi:hypothetical protein